MKIGGSKMRIAAFQFHTTGNIHENLAKICVTVDRAAELSVQLLAFPECALTGYPPRDIPSSSAVDRASLDKAHKELQVLADHHRMYLIVGTMTRMERGIHNTVMSFCPGAQPISYHKRALWGWDRDNFIPGDEPGIVEIDGVRIGIRICFEVRFPEYFRELYRQKTDINVIPFYDVSDRDDLVRYDLIRSHIRTRAVENVCPILTVNAVSPFQTAPTMLTGASGQILAETERNREELLVYDFIPQPPDFGERGRKEISDQLLLEHRQK